MTHTRRYTRVVIQKADLDTVAAGFVLGATIDRPLDVVVSVAAEEALDDPTVLCLECGGSGGVELGNFDHHDPRGPVATAVEQAWRCVGQPPALERLVEYVSRHDRGMSERAPDPALSLAGIFAAMRQVVTDERARFRGGLALLQWFVQRGRDPVGPLAEASCRDSAHLSFEGGDCIRPTLSTADCVITSGGRTLATLPVGKAGTLYSLYGAGADVVVAERWQGAEAPWRRLTVAVNPGSPQFAGSAAAMERIRQRLCALEAGWGGPAGGSILGSPRGCSSRLSVTTVVGVCGEEL